MTWEHPTTDDQKALLLWAAECAEHILHHFEAARPGDGRPRAAIEAGRAWVRGELTVKPVRAAALAAHAAARAVDDPAAIAAARAAGHAAATAHVATHAPGSAWYGLKAVRAAAARDAETREHAWQRRHLPDDLRAFVDELEARKGVRHP
jgi:hypothetical protein